MEHNFLLPIEELVRKIFIIRGKKVMFDFDLAKLYEIETRVLKQQVRRNIDRFPDDFMFELSRKEWEQVITNCDNLSIYSKYKPFPPFAFTEQGVAMLSSILRSKRAILVNIAIMRAFVNLRQLIDANKELIRRIDSLEEKYDGNFRLVFEAIKELIREENKPRKKIGYKIGSSEESDNHTI
jgi:hypothetical protein